MSKWLEGLISQENLNRQNGPHLQRAKLSLVISFRCSSRHRPGRSSNLKLQKAKCASLPGQGGETSLVMGMVQQGLRAPCKCLKSPQAARRIVQVPPRGSFGNGNEESLSEDLSGCGSLCPPGNGRESRLEHLKQGKEGHLELSRGELAGISSRVTYY